MLKRNKDQIKGTSKIHSLLRSTCLSLFFPTGAFPVEIQLLWLCLPMGHFWAVLSTAGNCTGWMNTEGLSQIFTAKAQICGAAHVGQSDWGNRSSWNFFPGLTGAWSFPIPIPTLKSAQGLTAVEPAGPVWLGTVLGTSGSSVGTEVWHRLSGARLALSLASDQTTPSPSLPPRIWGGEWKGERSMGLDNDDLITSTSCAHRQSRRQNSFPLPSTMAFQALAHPQHQQWLLRKPNSITTDVSHLLSPSFHKLLPLSTMP